MSDLAKNGSAAASGGLAAAIAMAIAQVVWLAMNNGDPAKALAWGASLAFIAFGFTYAVIFFVAKAKGGATKQATPPPPQQFQR